MGDEDDRRPGAATPLADELGDGVLAGQVQGEQWLVAQQDSGIDRYLATCWYAVGTYDKWEEYLRKQGAVPARDLEKRVRYKGVNVNTDGLSMIREVVQGAAP